jgi:hypothetical protein
VGSITVKNYRDWPEIVLTSPDKIHATLGIWPAYAHLEDSSMVAATKINSQPLELTNRTELFVTQGDHRIDF